MQDKLQPTVGGVPAGGLRDVYEVRILICYLLHTLKQPLTRQHLLEVVQESELANYFTFATAIAELIESNNVSLDWRDSQEYLVLEPLGKDTAIFLQQGVPPAARERVVASAVALLSRLKHAKENEVEITPLHGGYEVRLTIHDTNALDLLECMLFVPDRAQADIVKQRFLADPAIFYRKVVTFLVEE